MALNMGLPYVGQAFLPAVNGLFLWWQTGMSAPLSIHVPKLGGGEQSLADAGPGFSSSPLGFEVARQPGLIVVQKGQHIRSLLGVRRMAQHQAECIIDT